MRASTTNNNFTSGEITPLLHGRPELDPVQKGLSLCKNMKVLQHGGVTRREGTRFVAEAKYSDRNTAIIPFVYGVDEAYILEVGDQYIRVYTEAGIVIPASNPELVTNGDFLYDISGWTLTTSGSSTISWAPIQRMALTDYISVGSACDAKQQVTGLTIGHEYRLTFLRSDGSTFTQCQVKVGTSDGGGEYLSFNHGTNLFYSGTFVATSTTCWINFAAVQISGTAGTVYLSYISLKDTSAILEFATPFDAADVFDIMYAQSNDVMWLTHKDYPPQVITRLSATSFTIAAAAIEEGPFNPVNTTAITCTIGSSYTKGATATITFSSPYPPDYFTDVYFLLYDPADVTQYAIVKKLNGTESGGNCLNITDIPAGLQATPTTLWHVQAINSYYGYPGAVTLHDQRLIYAGTNSKPQNVYGSSVGNFSLFSFGTNDSDHLNYNLSSTKQGEIMFLASKHNLIAGSVSNEWNITGGVIDGPLTPGSVSARPHGSKGSRRIQPVDVESAVMFVQKAGHKLVAVQYDPQSRSLTSTDTTVLSEHLTSIYRLTQISYQKERDSIVWCVRDDGMLLGFTYNPEQSVAAWHQHDTQSGTFSSVATIPKSAYDQTWVLVDRMINGANVKMLEYFESNDWRIDDDPFYVDSGLTYAGAATSTLSGLDHLEGETVEVYSAGEYLGEYVVASGSITLDREVTAAHVGLGYNSIMTEVPDTTQAPDGSAEGRKKHRSRVTLRLYRTQGIKVNGDVRALPRDNPSITKPELYTGMVDGIALGWDKSAANTIESVGANPLTVLSINQVLNVNEA